MQSWSSLDGRPVNYPHHTPGTGSIAFADQQLNHHDILIDFDSEVDVEWVVQKLLRMQWWIGAPCNLECVPCSEEEGLQQFRGGEWVAPRVDPEWIDLSQWCQIAPTGCAGQSHPHNYGVPQFLDVIKSGHNISALGAWGPLPLMNLVVYILSFPRERPPITSGPLRSKVCNPATRRKSSERI